MERNEASRVEEQGKAGGKGKGKGKAKATSAKGKGKHTPAAATAGRATRSRSSSLTQSAAPAPSSNNFAIALPPTAPSYDELKQQVIRGMRADLERRQMSAEERRRLLESLRAFEEGGM